MKRRFIIHKQFVFILVACLLCPAFQDISSGQEFGKIYWMEKDGIRRANLDGSNVEDVKMMAHFKTDMALDSLKQKIYWVNSSTAQIQRANLDGTNVESIITGYTLPPEGGGMSIRCENLKCQGTASPDGGPTIQLSHQQLNKPYSLTIDTNANKIYWSNWHIDIIQRSNLDGTEIEDLTIQQRMIRDFKQWISPLNIALDIDEGMMYWTDGIRGKIGRANLDGTNIEYLFTDIQMPYGIALDLQARQIYWSNTQTGTIHRASMNGENAEVLVTGLVFPSDIDIDTHTKMLYWINKNPGKIQRSNLDGTNVTDVVTGLIFPIDVALDIREEQSLTDVTPDSDKLTTVWANVKSR